MRLRAAIEQLSAYALMRLLAVETRDLHPPEPAQMKHAPGATSAD
jgi:hypothetical protein